MQALRVAHENVAAIHQLANKFLKEPLLGGAVEVDDHVAAEDGIGPFSHAEVFHQVQSPEFDRLTQFRNYAHQTGLGVAAAHEILAPQVGRHGTYYIRREDSHLRFGENCGRDVGGQQTKAETGVGLRYSFRTMASV